MMRSLLQRLGVGLCVSVALAVTLLAQTSQNSAGGSFLPGDNQTVSGVWTFKGASPLTFEGATNDTVKTTLAITDPTAARTVTLPDATGTVLLNSGAVTSSSATGGVGYATGAGCAVTQASSKSTGVTCTGLSGTITLNAAGLATVTTVGFTVTDTSVAATDVVVVSIKSGATASSYSVQVGATAAGSFLVELRNYTGGTLSEAVVLSFAVIKGVAA